MNLEQGESNEAIKNFKNVIDNDFKKLPGIYYLGEAYQKLDLVDSAERIFQKIKDAIDPDEKNITYYFKKILKVCNLLCPAIKLIAPFTTGISWSFVSICVVLQAFVIQEFDFIVMGLFAFERFQTLIIIPLLIPSSAGFKAHSITSGSEIENNENFLPSYPEYNLNKNIKTSVVIVT